MANDYEKCPKIIGILTIIYKVCTKKNTYGSFLRGAQEKDLCRIKGV
jgi:hypothetical protein